MDEPQRERVTKWLEEKWQDHPCAVCGVDDWSASDPVAVKPYPEDFLGASIVPLIPVVCRNCGNTHFLNAVIAGLFPPRKS